MNDYRTDRDWADGLLPEMQAILGQHASKFVKVKVAPEYDDLHRATDLIMELDNGDAAVRVRRPDCEFRDFTLRCSRPSGKEIELAKITAGFGRWYLYAWTDMDGVRAYISAYIIVDLDRLRGSGILDRPWGSTRNFDESSDFIAIPIWVLYGEKCIVISSGVEARLAQPAGWASLWEPIKPPEPKAPPPSEQPRLL